MTIPAEEMSDYIRNCTKPLIRDYKLDVSGKLIRNTTFFCCELRIDRPSRFENCEFIACRIHGPGTYVDCAFCDEVK